MTLAMPITTSTLSFKNQDYIHSKENLDAHIRAFSMVLKINMESKTMIWLFINDVP